MTSQIDPSVFPDYRIVRKRDLRNQFSITKSEIEALQGTTGYRVATLGDVADLSLTGTLVITVDRHSKTAVYDPATYVYSATEPTSAGKVQDKVGNWFALQPDMYGYVHTAWLGDSTQAIIDAFTVSNFVSGTVGAEYTFSSTMTIPAGKNGHLDFRFCNIVKNTDDEAIRVQGTWGEAKTISSFSYDTEFHSVLNFAANPGFKQSALLKVISDDAGTDATAAGAILAPYARGMKAGEFTTVRLNPESTSIGLSGKLLFQDAYVTLPRVRDDYRRTHAHRDQQRFHFAAGKIGDLVKLDSCFGVMMDIFSTPFGVEFLCEIRGSYACFVRVRHHKGGPENGGYGMSFECSENCWGQIDYCGPVRHAGDGGAGPTGSHR